MIFVTGDTHGDISRFSDPALKKLKANDILIICGDFGFIWSGDKKEVKILEQLSKLKFKIAFVDGEHENFGLLSRYEEVEFCKGIARQISGNIYYLQRGTVYEFENNKVFTFGGGESVDKEARAEAGTWWECELPGLDEMRKGVLSLNSYDRQVDYIITHEPPAKIKKLISKSQVTTTNSLNAFLDEISLNVAYKRWFFGSTHVDKNISIHYRSIFTDIVPLASEK